MIYNQNEIALIFLSKFDFLTPTRFCKIMAQFKEIKDIFASNEQKLFDLKKILNDKYEILLNELSSQNANEYIDYLSKKNIKCTTIISKDYPQKLKRLKNPPYVLYYTGNLSLTNQKCIAVVGTRHPSLYGKTVTKKYGQELSNSGAVVVSGMASGIDTSAHEGALEGSGKTIAVLGSGFDNIFPKENLKLAREIAKFGLVITEYAPSIAPTKYTFPTRNRIIAGLCDAVILTEAGYGSGSLYTKDYADEVGIDTFCVPGQINQETSSATNSLIQSGAARSTVSPYDILQELNIKCLEKDKNKNDDKNKDISTATHTQKNIFVKQIDYSKLNPEQIKIVEVLKMGYSDFNDILIKTNISVQNLNINLTMLQISGIIKKLAGNSYGLC